MLYAEIDKDGKCFAISDLIGHVSSETMILISQGDCEIGFTYMDGTWTAPSPIEPPRRTILTHREFIILLGPHYAAIERLHDENAALPPDQKNYELSRLFKLWDAADYIDLADPDLAAAFATFVELGVMTQEAVDEILGA